LVAKNDDLDDIDGMRYILPLLVIAFAVPVFGQDAKPDETGLTANWSRIGDSVEKNRGFALYGRGIRLNRAGAYELWVKIVPANAAVFNKRYSLPKGTDYVLQYATVDCSKKLLLLERTALYDSSHKAVEGNASALTPPSKKDSVKPGSIGDALFRSVCDDPSLLPKTDAQN
jgi:hypothetical protein